MTIFFTTLTLPEFLFFIHFRYCITEKLKLLADKNNNLLWQSFRKKPITIYF